MNVITNGSDLLKFAAYAVRRAIPEALTTEGPFVNGKVDVVGAVAVLTNEKIAEATKGYFHLKEAELFDEDLLEIVATRLATEMDESVDEISAKIPGGMEAMELAVTIFDDHFAVGQAAIAQALDEAATRFGAAANAA